MSAYFYFCSSCPSFTHSQTNNNRSTTHTERNVRIPQMRRRLHQMIEVLAQRLQRVRADRLVRDQIQQGAANRVRGGRRRRRECAQPAPLNADGCADCRRLGGPQRAAIACGCRCPRGGGQSEPGGTDDGVSARCEHSVGSVSLRARTNTDTIAFVVTCKSCRHTRTADADGHCEYTPCIWVSVAECS